MPEQLSLITFLDHLKNKVVSVPIICLKSSAHYPLLFFSRVIDHLKNKQHISIQAIDFQGSSKQQIIGQLETSFLGATVCYWLRDISMLSTREQTFWHDYCAQYVGPNTILFFTKQDKIKHAYSSVTVLPELVDEQLFVQLTSFFGITLTTSNKRFIKKLFTHQSHGITLDSTCLMIEYMQLTGSDSEQFFTQSLHRLMPSDTSLFALSSAFMARKSAAFYPQWKKLGLLYSEQFWCSFFSELLWRGAEYVRLACKQDMIGARKIAYRLPFSFIKSDWRNLSHKELVAAHTFIYDADFKFKNGGGYAAFDLFFSSFFLKTFDI